MTGSLHWQTTRLSTCLVTNSRRRFVEAQKQKPSRKIFKDIASSTRPFRRGPLSTRGGRGRSNRRFTFSFKGFNFTRGKTFVSTTSQKLANLTRPSPGLLISEVFVPRGSAVPVPTGRKVKVFSEKLRKTVQQPSCTKYDFGLQGTLFGSTPSKLIPEASANVQGEISVSGYRNLDTYRERSNQMIDSSQDKYLSSIF